APRRTGRRAGSRCRAHEAKSRNDQRPDHGRSRADGARCHARPPRSARSLGGGGQARAQIAPPAFRPARGNAGRHESAAQGEIEAALRPPCLPRQRRVIPRAGAAARGEVAEFAEEKETLMPTIDADGCPINVEVAGPERAPVLMFSNSLGTNLRMWDDQAKSLSQRFRVVRYDQRGHGKSGAPKTPYTLDRLGTDVLAILDALKIER